MIASLIAALCDMGLEPTAEEVADVIWLAYHVIPARDPAREPDARPSTHGPERQTRQGQESPPEPLDSELPRSDGLHTWPSGGSHTAVGPVDTPFRSSSAHALPGALELGRALRPLMRRVGSRTRRILDEEATINRVAEERIWSPISRPEPTRWFEAALVIDEAASMSVWRETVREFRRLLELQGAFRDVRTWRLNTDLWGEPVSLRAGASGLLRSPTELTDPSGRRVIIVITDFVSLAWEGERLTRMLAEWGRHQPVAILQILPQRLWAQTSFYTARSVRVRPSRPGQPNAQLLKESGRPGRQPFDGTPVPVFTLEPTPAATWARLVAGLSGARAPAFLLPSGAWSLPQPPRPITTAVPVALTAGERLGMFRARVSPTAFELARLLAATPLTLPVMRLVQRVMLPESRQVHLAEVFLGGVLCRVSSGAEDTEEARYDFLPGLRELLLNSAHVPDSVAVIKVVSRYLEERVGQSLDFAAILANPEAASELTVNENNREFARVGAEVLRKFGGRYSAVADRLMAVSDVSPMPKPEPDDLVSRIMAGSQEAEEELVQRYSRAVPYIIKNIVRNPTDAQELAQETFMIALRKIRRGDLREVEGLSGFIRGIARNLTLEHLRKAQSRTLAAIDEVSPLIDSKRDPLEQLLQEEQFEIVRQVIGELSMERDRQIILRYYINEEDKESICASLDLTAAQFDRVSFRARARFKELYNKLTKVYPWAALPVRDFTVESGTLGDVEVERILGSVERYGIALFRMTGQSPDEDLVRAMGRLIGLPTPTQNTFTGEVKTIRPAPEGRSNSEDTTKDLGLHVDGTQHESQPALIIFQYVTEPRYGADSIFVDGARVLRDIKATRRHQVLTALAHPRAATFEKGGMRYTGPIFSMAGPHSVKCRIRFDEVIQILPELRKDYELLREAFNRDEYRASFKPREGDIIVFDNWRLLHTRDEVFGYRVREHRRMWISHLRPEHQPRFNLGVRPLPLQTLTEISRINKVLLQESP